MGVTYPPNAFTAEYDNLVQLHPKERLLHPYQTLVPDSLRNCPQQIVLQKQFFAILSRLPEPYRSMVIVAQCLGLRASEIVALQWGDFNFDDLTLLVQRSSVHGHVDSAKTEYSRDIVPIDLDLADVLMAWKKINPVKGNMDWVFPSPITGEPFH